MDPQDDAAPPDPGVPPDPPALPASEAGGLPRFDDIPPPLRTVLVVDDNVVFRAFLREVLRGRGFTVFEAENADAGLALALSRRPWLILSDVRMPGDGFEFCRRVREHSLLRQTPLLFLSGRDDFKARYRGLELGADDFVSKETPVRELLIRMQLAMKRHMVGKGGRRPGPGMQGQIDMMGAPGVLQTCHLMKLTGTLVVDDGARHVGVRFRDGEVVGAEGGDLRGEDALFALLGWEQGTFRFVPGDPGPGASIGPFSQLVLEGCRRLDETRREDASHPAGGGPRGPAPAD